MEGDGGERGTDGGGQRARAWRRRVRRRARACAALVAALVAAAACGEPGGTGGEGRDGGDRPEQDASERPSVRDSSLRAMARGLVPTVESLAALTFRRPPRLASSSRAELEAYLVDHLEEEWPRDRARAVRDAYARLGLVPDTLDLRGLLRNLYLEQVVGYYDPAADTLFVRRGVDSAMVRTVLVHELVHALQDQHLDLDSLTDALSGRNDRSTAARSALEGQATYVMIEWELARRTGRRVDLTRLPDLSELPGGSDLSSLAGMPALASAPRIVRETAIFPYLGGLGMMQALWRSRPGRPAPMGRWMPASTEQVLHPERLLSEPPDRPERVRFEPPPDGWRQRHADVLGELETRVWLSAHLADTARARAAAAGWDGDRWRLLRGPDGETALAWVTVWDDAGEARAFRRAAAEAWNRLGAGRPGRRHRVRLGEADGRPVVTVWEGPSGFPDGTAERALRFRLEGGG